MCNIHKIFKYGLIILYFLFFIRNLNYGFLSFLSICIHELAHILVIKIEDISNLRFSVLGFRIDTGKWFSVKYENLIYISGSLLNVFVGFVSLILVKFFGVYFLYEFMIINFLIGFVNLIPVFPLDGAILFKNFLFSKLNRLKSTFISIFVSFFLASIWLCFSVYFMFRFYFINFSYVLVVGFMFISTYREYKIFKSTFLITSLDNREYKFLKKGYMNTNIISLDYNIRLFDIIKLCNLRKFLIFYFVDDNLKIVGIMNEFDIFKKYKEFGNVQVRTFYEK